MVAQTKYPCVIRAKDCMLLIPKKHKRQYCVKGRLLIFRPKHVVYKAKPFSDGQISALQTRNFLIKQKSVAFCNAFCLSGMILYKFFGKNLKNL